MTDLLVATILVGASTTFVISFINVFTEEIIGKSILNKTIAAPLSFGGMYVLLGLDLKMIVTVPAATFVSLAINRWLDKPTVIERTRLPRIF